MVISVCIGSSCHLKGSREVIIKLQEMIAANHLENQVTLTGAFCMGECMKGVCVKINDELFSLTAQNTEGFFQKEILGRIECSGLK